MIIKERERLFKKMERTWPRKHTPTSRAEGREILLKFPLFFTQTISFPSEEERKKESSFRAPLLLLLTADIFHKQGKRERERETC